MRWRAPGKLELPTLCLEDTQYKILRAASGRLQRNAPFISPLNWTDVGLKTLLAFAADADGWQGTLPESIREELPTTHPESPRRLTTRRKRGVRNGDLLIALL